ncbi:hypothetical protein HMPREF3293_02314 [Christensenella minuta]|uniref:Uncharacterized protein n=1 Tax=Christensenella minuta TaxID=626937 RepID=A0A136Q344_9FIRM|nr:hypothetical protein HMPREF3293_02314 [Christensenella minuta]
MRPTALVRIVLIYFKICPKNGQIFCMDETFPGGFCLIFAL